MFANLFANRRAKAARHARRSLSERRLRCEPLEARQLLSVGTYANNTALPIKDNGTVTSAIEVSDSFMVVDLNVKVNIQHARDPDLDVFLISPDGTRVELFTDVGATRGQNFTDTVLDDTSDAPIILGTAPFTGTFRPEGNLSAVEGKQAQGTWKLEITDDSKQKTGTLMGWSIDVTSDDAPPGFLDKNSSLLGDVSTSISDVVVSENGDAMAMWLESKGPGGTGPLMAMAARYDHAKGNWETPAIISNPSFTWGVETWGRIATDGQGNYLAAWQQAVSSVDSGRGYGSIWVNRYVAGSGWQTPQTIETDREWSYDPVVAMAYDPAAKVSKAVVVWTYGSEMKVNRLTDFAKNTWSGPAPAEDLSVGINNGNYAVDMVANGDFLVVFQTNVAPYDVYSRHYNWSAANWGPEVALESLSAVIDYRIALDMNATGAAIVSWVQRTGTAGEKQVWARLWNGLQWSNAEVVSDDPAPVMSNGSRVAISDNGEAAVLYVQQRAGALYKDAYVSRHNGTAWQASIKVDSEHSGNVGAGRTENGEGPIQIAMDNSGNILAAWQQSDGVFTNIWVAKFDHSALDGVGAWLPAAKLEDAPYEAGNIAMAMNTAGVATTIWTQTGNTLTHVYASRDSLTPVASQTFAAAPGISLTLADAALLSLTASPTKTTSALAAKTTVAPIAAPSARATQPAASAASLATHSRTTSPLRKATNLRAVDHVLTAFTADDLTSEFPLRRLAHSRA